MRRATRSLTVLGESILPASGAASLSAAAQPVDTALLRGACASTRSAL